MRIIQLLCVVVMALLLSQSMNAQQKRPERPRILISTDIGGTDPDDNQSMMHFLLYSNMFDTEGLISSPSYGNGNKGEILRMIGLYEQDLSKLKKHGRHWPSPDYLRSITKQGRHGRTVLQGYYKPTEGSEWIIRCARKKDRRPLYVLVWGGLEDLAQALHDAPDIQDKIRVHWIGGPNKKWSLNSYVYIVKNFPNLWFIEDNASYRGFIAKYKQKDRWNGGFYDYYVRGAGHLGADFVNYKGGLPKLGDTPSLLYMLDGDPAKPERESWGGSYVKVGHSPRLVLNRRATAKDTVQTYGIIEFQVKGPQLADSMKFRPVMWLIVDRQKWEGYYMGDGDYMVRYSTYKYGTHPYTIFSEIDGFPIQQGCFTVKNIYPGRHRKTDYKVGSTWWTDRHDASLFWDNCQGAMTVYKWRKDVIEDWGKRCSWLR